MFTAGVLSRLPADWFGPESVKRYAVRFASRIWPGDTLTCKAAVARVYDEGGVTHVDLGLSVENQNGETLIQAEATRATVVSADVAATAGGGERLLRHCRSGTTPVRCCTRCRLRRATVASS